MSKRTSKTAARLTLLARRGGLLDEDVHYEPTDGWYIGARYIGPTVMLARRRIAQMRAEARRVRWRRDAAYRDARAKAVGEVILGLAARAAPVIVDTARSLADSRVAK